MMKNEDIFVFDMCFLFIYVRREDVREILAAISCSRKIVLLSRMLILDRCDENSLRVKDFVNESTS